MQMTWIRMPAQAIQQNFPPSVGGRDCNLVQMVIVIDIMISFTLVYVDYVDIFNVSRDSPFLSHIGKHLCQFLYNV